jgi:four helix bundle protein
MNFSHENLKVYQLSLDFVDFTNNILAGYNYRMDVYQQLDRASTSIPLNIAEGTGKYTGKDKCRFYDIARGSALECAACLDLLFIRNRISETIKEEGKGILIEIVSMLFGLIKSNSKRIYEQSVEYRK